MRAKVLLVQQLKEIVAEMGLEWSEKITLEPPKDKQFGDLAVNVAMILAKQAGQPPRALAETFAARLKAGDSRIKAVEVAGPGFLNITYSEAFWQQTVQLVLRSGAAYGCSDSGKGKKVQVEFVSANPTGPLHIGHGRGAAVGDSTARVMRAAGYDVRTEYYINDAGKQMRILGYSVWLRALELEKRPVEWPEDWYRGQYIVDIAKEVLAKHPGLLDKTPEEAQDICFEYAMSNILEGIKADLKAFNVAHEVWFSERTLVQDGSVDKAFALLADNGYSYERDGALWFKTTEFGDDLDRVLRKSDGSLTYFASDIAYHSNKYDRGFELLVDVWGADHHGYIPRLRAAVQALGKPVDSFDVILIQLVNLMENGKQIAMSTRKGQFETLADVIKEVGSDAARFMFLSRKSDSPLDFDLELVKQRTMDNPVYYVQYAHARICAILRRAEEKNPELTKENSGEFSKYLVHKAELDLLRRADAFSELIATSAAHLAPHHISYYLQDMARELHAYYAAVQVLNAENDDIVTARLTFLKAIAQVLKNGLTLLGVSAPESM